VGGWPHGAQVRRTLGVRLSAVAQQRPHAGRVVAHAGQPLDHRRDSLQRPQPPVNPFAVAPSMRACSTWRTCASDSRGAGPLGPLLRSSPSASGLPAGMPGAHGLGGDGELAGDLGLADASGEQFGCAEAAALEPFAFSLGRRTARDGSLTIGIARFRLLGPGASPPLGPAEPGMEGGAMPYLR
jgi:hypothetical protein